MCAPWLFTMQSLQAYKTKGNPDLDTPARPRDKKMRAMLDWAKRRAGACNTDPSKLKQRFHDPLRWIAETSLPNGLQIPRANTLSIFAVFYSPPHGSPQEDAVFHIPTAPTPNRRQRWQSLKLGEGQVHEAHPEKRVGLLVVGE